MSHARSLLLVLGAAVLAGACSTPPTLVGSPATPRRASRAEPGPRVESAPKGRCSSLHAGHPTPLEPGRGERVVLAKDGARTLAYVANEDDGAVHTIDVGAGREIAVTPLTGSPSALVGLRDGRIACALRNRNEIVVLEPDLNPAAPLVELCAREVPSEPVGLAATEVLGEEERILVTSGYGHALSALRERDLESVLQVDLRRDPRAVLAHEGKAFVSHMSSSELDVIDLSGGALSTVDVLGSQRAAGIALKTREDRPGEPPMIRGGQVFALASSEGRLFVPMVSVDPGEPKITGSYGSTEVPIKPFVGVVDLVSTRELRIGVPSQTSALHRACMLPRAAAAAPGGKLFVACAGIDELLELDGRADNAARAPHRRVRLPSGPVGLALDGTEVVVLSQFDREVSIVPLAEGGEVVRVGLSRPVAAADEAFERGRKIFHDSFDVRVSADGRACASCHPDGRDDGNTWSTPDGPRQTPSLAGRIAGSGPYGWFGRHPTLDSHLAETMHRLGGRGFAGKGDRADLAALETYLTKMKAPVVPTVDDPRVRVGRALFHDAKQGCGTCHAEGSTDRVRHDVGSGHAEESSMQFDTPSLAFVSATAPYFHDGRYATLDELLAKGNDRMGHAKHLDADQRASLVAYMDSLAPRAEPGSELAPVSFTAAGPLRPLTPEAASPLERLLLDAEGPPRVFRDVDFDIATVPVVSVSKVPEWNAKSAEAQGSALPSGEIVWNHGCAAVPHHAAAHLSFDWRSTSMTSRLERCVYAPDPNGFFYWSDASMTTIDPLPNGNLHVVTRQAFIRLTSNEIRVAREISVEATRLADGLVFAYRTKCDDCKEDERDQLHLVMPSDAQTIFDTIALNLARGTAGHTSTSVTPSVLSSWTTATGTHIESGSTPGDPRGILLGIDVSRTESEDEARVTLGKASCHAGEFGACL